MSTELQQYSIANQSATIALYAAAHQLGIVRSFVDEGRSGTTIKRRAGLQELIRIVESGSAGFEHVLVYDVSRWGRFSDSDEAAYYEFVCKRAGIAVHYCAEQFDNDNSVASTLLKALKRTMAGEYSRELGVKVSAGQRRLALMGFWQGGFAPFGFERQLVSANGEPKRILKYGEWKNIDTDRILLTPGPKEAVETVRLAFDLYTNQGKSRPEVVSILNEQKRFLKTRPWNASMLRDLFTNPVYKGTYVYGKHNFRGGNFVRQARDKWQAVEHAFPGIVSDEQWSEARDRVMAEWRPFLDSEMLDDLRRLWKREGRLNTELINAARDVASAPAYVRHFGSVNKAYDLIGYPFPRQYDYLRTIGLMRQMRNKLCEELCEQIRAAGGQAEHRCGFPDAKARGLVLVNGNITVQVTFSSPRRWRRNNGHACWQLFIGKHSKADVLIVARVDPDEQAIKDYYVLPAFSQLRGAIHVREVGNAPFLDAYRFATLGQLVQSCARFSSLEAA